MIYKLNQSVLPWAKHLPIGVYVLVVTSYFSASSALAHPFRLKRYAREPCIAVEIFETLTVLSVYHFPIQLITSAVLVFISQSRLVYSSQWVQFHSKPRALKMQTGTYIHAAEDSAGLLLNPNNPIHLLIFRTFI